MNSNTTIEKGHVKVECLAQKHDIGSRSITEGYEINYKWSDPENGDE